MPPFQTSYASDLAPGALGAEADTSMVSDIMGRNNPDERALFGHVVCKHAANDEAIKAPAAATDITDEKLVQGVVLASQIASAIMPEPAASQLTPTDPGYEIKSPVSVMRKGRIWVKPETAVTVGTSTVNVRFAGTGNKGAFRGAAVTDETAVLAKAKWRSSTSSGGQLAILELDL